ncbi:MAG: hypothetical protein R3B89_14710 [Polyangiaceae bacterium]
MKTRWWLLLGFVTACGGGRSEPGLDGIDCGPGTQLQDEACVPSGDGTGGNSGGGSGGFGAPATMVGASAAVLPGAAPEAMQVAPVPRGIPVVADGGERWIRRERGSAANGRLCGERRLCSERRLCRKRWQLGEWW